MKSKAQQPACEERYAEEIRFLQAWDEAAKPPNWKLSPRAVVTFVCGSNGEALKLKICNIRLGHNAASIHTFDFC